MGNGSVVGAGPPDPGPSSGVGVGAGSDGPAPPLPGGSVDDGAIEIVASCVTLPPAESTTVTVIVSDVMLLPLCVYVAC
jgi:hypothetical protein